MDRPTRAGTQRFRGEFPLAIIAAWAILLPLRADDRIFDIRFNGDVGSMPHNTPVPEETGNVEAVVWGGGGRREQTDKGDPFGGRCFVTGTDTHAGGILVKPSPVMTAAFNGSWSVEGWLMLDASGHDNPDANGIFQYDVGRQAQPGRLFIFYGEERKFTVYTFDGEVMAFLKAFDMPPRTSGKSEWFHFAVTYADNGSPGNVKVYRNGEFTTTNTEPMPMGSRPLAGDGVFIARYGWAGMENTFLRGAKWDNFRLYRGVLSPTQVRNNYEHPHSAPVISVAP